MSPVRQRTPHSPGHHPAASDHQYAKRRPGRKAAKANGASTGHGVGGGGVDDAPNAQAAESSRWRGLKNRWTAA